MPWSQSTGRKDGFDAERTIARLSYHIDRRCKDLAVFNQIVERTGIAKTTLHRYRRYSEILEGRDKAGDLPGPRKIPQFLQVCEAMGENPGKVIYAAMISDSYATMVTILEADLLASLRIGFEGDETAPLLPIALPSGVSPRHVASLSGARRAAG